MFEFTHFPDWLRQRAASHRDHPAIIDGARVLTFDELDGAVGVLALQLQRLGIAPGNRIGVLLRNGAEFARTMHAVTRSGAILVPLDHRLSPSELRQRIQDAPVSILLHDADHAHLAGELDAPGLRSIAVAAEAHDASLMTHDRSHPVDLTAVHSIVFTSGSSGRAKGVMLTHGNFLWNAVGSAFNLGLQTDDRWLACLPLCHVGGLSILLRGVIYGMTVVMHDRFDPERVNDAIDTQRVTIVSVVANMLQRMLDMRGVRAYPPWLRCILVGGGPVPRALLENCVARGLPVVQTYGMTEAASQIATLQPGDALSKLGSCGKALFGTEIAIAGQSASTRAGETGEILVRGPTVSPGYIDGDRPISDPEGWFHTGDLGRLDDEGFLYILGRADDMIISGGENIHPAEIEAVLQLHPAVAEAFVLAAPDPRWGSVPAAQVRLRAGTTVTPEELQTHARAQLAGFKVPRHIRIVDDFPRSSAGKILRKRPAS